MTLRDVIDLLTVYEIRKCDFVENLIVSKKKTNHGYCDHESRTIYVDKNISLSEMRQVIIHELVHAWLEMKGIPDPEDAVDEIGDVVYRACYPIKNLIEG